jgi:hypothetical protein
MRERSGPPATTFELYALGAWDARSPLTAPQVVQAVAFAYPATPPADLAEAIRARTPATALDRVAGLIAKAHARTAAGASSRRPFPAPAGKKRTRFFPRGGPKTGGATPPPPVGGAPAAPRR